MSQQGSQEDSGSPRIQELKGNKKKVTEAARSAHNQEEEEDCDVEPTLSPCLPLPELKDMVSQLNEDLRAESTANSGRGTIAMEEDIKLNTVKVQPIRDSTSHAALDNSDGPDDLTWNADIPYFEFTDNSATACKTPVATSTPVVAPAGCHPLSHHGARNCVSVRWWLKGYRVYPQ